MKNTIISTFIFLTIILTIASAGYFIDKSYPEPTYQTIEFIEDESIIDTLNPAAKEKVERVIEKYYKETTITSKNSIPTSTKSKKPNARKTAKYIEIHETDIEVIDKIAIYIKQKEGFRAKAYKDNTQYSIGYGTRATSSTEVITQKEANIRLYKHIKKVIIPSFKGVKFHSIEQIYSAIDFSYNVGQNRFKKSVVTESGTIDCSKMMAYNKTRDKNGNLIYNEGLAQRRFENFLSCTAYDTFGD